MGQGDAAKQHLRSPRDAACVRLGADHLHRFAVRGKRGVRFGGAASPRPPTTYLHRFAVRGDGLRLIACG